MPIQVSQICREILAPWPLELCTCGETQSVSVQWNSCHADKADLFVLLLFFQKVVRRPLPMRAYLVQFQFLSSSMNLFFTSNETCRDVRDGIRYVSLPLHAL